MPLSRQRRFPRARRSVPAARGFALETLADWGYLERRDDVLICVSELSTNALLHGVPPGRQFSLTLVGGGPLVRIEVRDSGGGLPEVTEADADACRGRGLSIVRAVADDFGVTLHEPGKTVWTVLKMDPQGQVPAAETADIIRLDAAALQGSSGQRTVTP
ncbi:ATP-binding protein [Streptomyces sp. SID9913]|uniref:ATP-binding protein n=1 Tax=unclassified Streptomyces TaxID=2593676 RepID=UPI0013D9010A|nr:ATP-binding protein [Streptomyces sp. S12]NED18038.1 ATP-binding protein [Streptomyces sp. SID9913]